MAGYFISATGTDAGKTLFTAGLVWQLRQQGKQAHAVKPVVSGFTQTELAASDTGQLLAAMEQPVNAANADAISPWRYPEPLSPHIAGRHDASLTDETITAFCEYALKQDGLCLIEGAGGIMSPLVQGFTQADLVQRLNIPVILLAGCYLGSISHTLTAVEALRARGIAIAAIGVNAGQQPLTSLEDTRDSIASHLPQALPVFTLPVISPTTKPIWQSLPPLTEYLSHG